MIKGALVVTNNNLSNKIFEQNKDYQNDRGFMNIYSALKKIFFDFGVDLNTQDYYKKSEADFYLYADYNNNFNNSNIKNSFLIVREPPTALKTNHLKSNEANKTFFFFLIITSKIEVIFLSNMVPLAVAE